MIHLELKELQDQIEAKFQRWNVWRTAGKEWHFEGVQSGVGFSINCGTVSEAFEAALKWVPLPVVPRAPMVLSPDGFRFVKSGSKWRVLYTSRDCGVSVRTKTEAAEFADRARLRSEEAYDKWRQIHGWTDFKTEGVDFRYSQG